MHRMHRWEAGEASKCICAEDTGTLPISTHKALVTESFFTMLERRFHGTEPPVSSYPRVQRSQQASELCDTIQSFSGRQ